MWVTKVKMKRLILISSNVSDRSSPSRRVRAIIWSDRRPIRPVHRWPIRSLTSNVINYCQAGGDIRSLLPMIRAPIRILISASKKPRRRLKRKRRCWCTARSINEWSIRLNCHHCRRPSRISKRKVFFIPPRILTMPAQSIQIPINQKMTSIFFHPISIRLRPCITTRTRNSTIATQQQWQPPRAIHRILNSKEQQHPLKWKNNK